MSQQQVQPQPVAQPASRPVKSGLAVTALVLGIVAVVLSFIPLINNLAVLLAIVGLVFGIVALVKKQRKAMSIVGVVLAVVAVAISLVVQYTVGKALDSMSDEMEKAVNGPTAVATSGATSDGNDDQGEEKEHKTQQLTVGQTVTLENGLKVTVNSVDPNFTAPYNDPAVKVDVTYENTGKEKASYNSYDWRGTDANGAEKTATISTVDNVKMLESGDLKPGGTVSGTVFFEQGTVMVGYYPSFFNTETPAAEWKIG